MTQYVYLVRQTQNNIDACMDDIYKNETIYVCSNKDEAIRRARELNKEYGKGCVFNDEWDFEEIDYDDVAYDDLHYYDVETMTVDAPFAEDVMVGKAEYNGEY